jgi:acetate kinase
VRVLVVNAGSTSLKLRLLGPDDAVLAARDVPAGDEEALRAFLAGLEHVDVAGHRVVHGGARFRGPAVVDDEVLAALRELVVLAPLHQPGSLAGIEAVAGALPGVPNVACFDTAFHATLPAAAATYAVPREWRVRRYGFHGLSHAYAARRAAELCGDERRRIVTCHLGAGASLAAVLDGRAVDTTMGFTPLEGLAMATRSGSVDPGMLLWLLQRGELSVDDMHDALEHRSGMRALAGTADMEAVIARAEAHERHALLAFEVYVHRLRAGIAAMAAAVGGLDALVFTGGVGENAPAVRAAACGGLSFLGVGLDGRRNVRADGDADIGADHAAVRTLVVAAREDLEIARQARAVLAG